jgi:hypothetical protein
MIEVGDQRNKGVNKKIPRFNENGSMILMKMEA